MDYNEINRLEEVYGYLTKAKEKLEPVFGDCGKRGIFAVTKFFSQYATLPPVITKENWVNDNSLKAVNDFVDNVIELKTDQKKREKVIGRYDRVELSLVKRAGSEEGTLAGPFSICK